MSLNHTWCGPHHLSLGFHCMKIWLKYLNFLEHSSVLNQLWCWCMIELEIIYYLPHNYFPIYEQDRNELKLYDLRTFLDLRSSIPLAINLRCTGVYIGKWLCEMAFQMYLSKLVTYELSDISSSYLFFFGIYMICITGRYLILT